MFGGRKSPRDNDKLHIPVSRGPGTLVNPWLDKFLIFRPSSVSLGSFISTFFFLAASFVPFPSSSDFLSFGVEAFGPFGLFVSDLPDSGRFGDFPEVGRFGDLPDWGLVGDLPDSGRVGDPFLVGDGDCLLGEPALDFGDPCLLLPRLLVGLWNYKL